MKTNDAREVAKALKMGRNDQASLNLAAVHLDSLADSIDDYRKLLTEIAPLLHPLMGLDYKIRKVHEMITDALLDTSSGTAAVLTDLNLAPEKDEDEFQSPEDVVPPQFRAPGMTDDDEKMAEAQKRPFKGSPSYTDEPSTPSNDETPESYDAAMNNLRMAFINGQMDNAEFIAGSIDRFVLERLASLNMQVTNYVNACLEAERKQTHANLMTESENIRKAMRLMIELESMKGEIKKS